MGLPQKQGISNCVCEFIKFPVSYCQCQTEQFSTHVVEKDQSPTWKSSVYIFVERATESICFCRVKFHKTFPLLYFFSLSYCPSFPLQAVWASQDWDGTNIFPPENSQGQSPFCLLHFVGRGTLQERKRTHNQESVERFIHLCTK